MTEDLERHKDTNFTISITNTEKSQTPSFNIDGIKNQKDLVLITDSSDLQPRVSGLSPAISYVQR